MYEASAGATSVPQFKFIRKSIFRSLSPEERFVRLQLAETTIKLMLIFPLRFCFSSKSGSLFFVLWISWDDRISFFLSLQLIHWLFVVKSSALYLSPFLNPLIDAFIPKFTQRLCLNLEEKTCLRSLQLLQVILLLLFVKYERSFCTYLSIWLSDYLRSDVCIWDKWAEAHRHYCYLLTGNFVK